MLGGVLSHRVVATADVTALEAESKMDPLHTQPEALLAAFGGRRRHIAHFTQVLAAVHG
jgi:hypothetical protein